MLFIYGMFGKARLTKKPVGNISGPKISGDCLDYKKGKLLACSYQDNSPIQIFDFRKREVFSEVKCEGLAVYSADFSPVENDYSVFVGSSSPNCMKVFESKGFAKESYEETWNVGGFEKGLYSTHIADNCRTMAIGCGDGFVTVLNINNFE